MTFARASWSSSGIQDFMGFSNVYQGFKTISRVFSIISWVFNIFSKVVASKSKRMGTGTLSTGYKVLQRKNQLCVGSKVLDVRLMG